jgi:succinate dehydrogenase / fumarate reductase, cytochrome b subunit
LSVPLIKAVATVLAWALWHHLLAGIRYLFTDIALGLELAVARRTAWIVNALSVMGLLGLIGMWWL